MDCQEIENKPDARDGIYWIDLDGEGGDPAFKAQCDMTNGGYTLLYAAHASENTQGSWALSWDRVLTVGVNAENLSWARII